MKPTRFDIYAREGGRWSRRASFAADEHAAALAAASDLDRSDGFEGVRVMAVTEYGGGRPPLETLNWISPHLSKVASVQRQMKSAADKAVQAQEAKESQFPIPPVDPMPIAVPPPPPVLPRPAKKRVRTRPAAGAPLAGRLVGNVLIAVAVAGIAFVPLTAMFRAIGVTESLPAVQQGAFALFAAAGVFIVVATLLMARVYRTYRTVVEEEFEAPPPLVLTPTQQPRQKPEAPADLPRRPPGEFRPTLSDDDEDTSAPADMPTRPVTPSAPSSAGTKSAAAEPVFGEDARRAVLEFLALALAAVKDEVPRMNQHVTFGLNLFGAGAAEFYGKGAGLNRMQSFVLVREVVSALGNSADRVDAFCRQYGEYAAEERYRMMIDCGRSVMEKRISGDGDPFAEFREILRSWTSDAAVRAKSQGIVCIMFTDIVGSTAMTHERGDYAAQEVVRVHNAIVRSALAAHHGKEVKHTGDGIMASFTIAANAVRATMEIRDTLAKHNAAEGAVPVKVRIGLNAGEAVQEEDDFFGTTVQLAARVCDKAGTGEVFVTDNVRTLAKGNGLSFQEAGEFVMKGVPAPMMLYRVGAGSS